MKQGAVKSIYFEYGECFGPGSADNVLIKRLANGKIRAKAYERYSRKTTTWLITEDEWAGLLDVLYGKLAEWEKHEYIDSSVLDGTAWELRIDHTDGHKTKYYGLNAYPPGWEEVLELFIPFLKKQDEQR